MFTNFGKKELEKYGWQIGKGIGKNENGINVPIKPKLKFDQTGIGYDISNDFTTKWWENIYNKAANNIQVENDVDKVKMNLIANESVDITTKKYRIKNVSDLKYGSFIKTATLVSNTLKPTDKVENYVECDEDTKVSHITDDELFSVCENRTVHKGARHGLNLKGKLSRLAAQEKLLMKKLQGMSLSEETADKTEKKLQKIAQVKEKIDLDSDAIPDAKHKKKRKKKSKKSVCFNEVVTEYHVPDLETSFQSNESSGTPEPPPSPIVCHRKIKENYDNDSISMPNFSAEIMDKYKTSKPKRLKKIKYKGATEKFLDELSINKINHRKRKWDSRGYEEMDFICGDTKIICPKHLTSIKRSTRKKKKYKKKLAEKRAMRKMKKSTFNLEGKQS